MFATEERVDRLETALTRLIETVDRVVLEMRAYGARTDAILVRMERRAEKAREQADKDRQQAEKDRQQAEKDRQQAEKDRQQAEKDRKDFNKRLAELSDSMGTLVEDMVRPNAASIAQALFGDDPVLTIAQRVGRRHPADPGRNAEADLLVAGNHNVMVVEAKRKITPEKIAEFAERIEGLKEFFPEYARHRWIPVVASVSIDPTVVSYLNRRRVYGVALSDDTMALVNLGAF